MLEVNIKPVKGPKKESHSVKVRVEEIKEVKKYELSPANKRVSMMIQSEFAVGNENKAGGVNFLKMMDNLSLSARAAHYKELIDFKLRKIIRKENSFLFGFTEVISNNFDFVFRFGFAISFLLLMAVQFVP